MKANIIKFFFGLIIAINVIAYPIGKTISDSANINNAMTSMDFEQKFLDIFKEVTVQQLATSTNQTRDQILSQINGDLISKDNLKKQREEQVIKFFKDLEEGKAPNFRLEIENPLSKFTNTIKDKAKEFIDNVKNIQICTKGDDSFLCRTFGDTINSLLGRDKDGNVVDESVKPSDQPNFVFETSLGIDQNNVQTWSNIYKVAKYGPDALLGVSLALMTLYYLFTWPKTKSAFSMLITVIKADVLAVAIWGLIPLIFNTTNPIRITTQADIQGNVNLIVSGAITEAGKTALIIPLIFTAVALVMVVLSFIIPKIGMSRITNESGKIEGLGSHGKHYEEVEEDDDSEEDSEEEDDKKEEIKSQTQSAESVPNKPDPEPKLKPVDPNQPLSVPIKK